VFGRFSDQEVESMRTQQITARLPAGVVARIDGLAASAGLARADFLRMILSRVSDNDLPVGLVENADRLREARGVMR
jgi:hypothetical protein